MVIAGDERQQYAIAFYNEAVPWVRERQWAVDQEIVDTDNGVVIYFSGPQHHKVLEWVLSRGCAARPFAPEALVKDWQRHVFEMGRMARKK
jgi:hypothetical protein